MPKATATDPVMAFIEQMRIDLFDDEDEGMIPPIEKRKLRTVLAACKHKGTKVFLNRLEGQLEKAGIYTETRLSDSGLLLDDWVLFSTGPFPPDSWFFPREDDLRRFVEACLGKGKFRNLHICRFPGHKSGREYQLGDGRKIDLLCEERTKKGPGALVAIELKREHELGTVTQLIGYMDALRQLYPSRDVKGIIISGREERAESMVLRTVAGYDIEWFCYQVKFDRVPTSR